MVVRCALLTRCLCKRCFWVRWDYGFSGSTPTLFLPSWLVFFTHWIIYPNMLVGIGIRKLRIEKAVREFLSSNHEGIVQVWNVGAGLDTLTVRLAPEYPDVRFWELDHPATAAVKQNAVKEYAKPLPPNLAFVSADLSETSLENVMGSTSFDCKAPTIVVLEGLLMYLEEGHVKELLANLHKTVGSGSRIALDHFGFKNNLIDNGWLTYFQMWSASRLGEPWLWGIDPRDLASFLARDGLWRVVSQDGRTGFEFGAVLERV